MATRSTGQDVKGTLTATVNVEADVDVTAGQDVAATRDVAAGRNLSVTGVNDLIQIKHKTGDSDYVNETLASDPDLQFAVVNGQVWSMRIVGYIDISDKGIQMKILTPGGSSGYWSGILTDGGAHAVDRIVSKQGVADTWTWATGAAKTDRIIAVDAYVVVGSTGTIIIQFANAIAGVGTMKLEAGSNLHAVRD